jgi:hypothetical protein
MRLGLPGLALARASQGPGRPSKTSAHRGDEVEKAKPESELTFAIDSVIHWGSRQLAAVRVDGVNPASDEREEAVRPMPPAGDLVRGPADIGHH